MLVRKMAGNTLAKPASSGSPRPESHTATPMANAAIEPRATKTCFDTDFVPLGAGWGRALNATTTTKRAPKPNTARARSVIEGSNTCSTVQSIVKPSTVHNISAPEAVHNRARGEPSNQRGSTSQAPKNNALSNIPNGTTDMLEISAASPPARYMPMAAGTMVEGAVPNKPPTRPPHFSMATVTAVATIPANRAESKMDASAMLNPPKPSDASAGAQRRPRSIGRPPRLRRRAR